MDQFIECWKKFYVVGSNEISDKAYNNLMRIADLTPSKIQTLFEWKNQGNLSLRKQVSVNKIKNNLDEIKKKFQEIGDSDNELKEIFDHSVKKYFKYGYIWNLFFLHILKSYVCPIADRHAYRAFYYIRHGENKLPVFDWDTFLEYKSFFNEIMENTKYSRKELDEALWGFGKFLSLGFEKIIVEG